MFRHVKTLPLIAALALAAASCSRFPELERRISPEARAADYPALLPLDEALAGTRTRNITSASAETLLVRVAGLRAQARYLQRPVLSRADRTRLQAAIRRHHP